MQTTLGVLPMNITMLVLTSKNMAGIKEVKVLDIMEGASKTFHPEGLYSVEIFDKVGTERRNRLYGYISLGTEILHPLAYRELVGLKELYGQIMSGSAYATFDDKVGDFIVSDIVKGETGYSFFMKHFRKLKLDRRNAVSREFAIDFLEKEKDNLLMENLLVLPAGLRDYFIGSNGKPEEDDINSIYRRILSIAGILKGHTTSGGDAHLNATRHSLQMAIQEIYIYLLNITQGKEKLVQGHWTARNIHYTSRNVITAAVQRADELFDKRTIGLNTCVIGLYQYMMSVFPLAAFHIRQYASKIFVDASGYANVTDKKTLTKISTRVSPKRYDEWMTQDGLEGTMARFETEAFRHDAIEVDGYYFGLLYDDGSHIRFCQGKEELPEGFDPKYLSPITYAELYYLSLYMEASKTPAFLTRYPVIELGSVFPVATSYLRSTAHGRSVELLNDAWEVHEVLHEFPVKGDPFFDSLNISHTHLAKAGADFDGDMMSYLPVLTDEGRKDVMALLNDVSYYVSAEGGLNFSASNVISDLVFRELTM